MNSKLLLLLMTLQQIHYYFDEEISEVEFIRLAKMEVELKAILKGRVF